MTPNEQLLTTFYHSFQKKDYKTMQSCYADHATFSDEVFINLNAKEVKAMWEMLIKRGTDLELTYKNVKATETHGTAEWTASYTFSATKRKVVNHIKSSFIFENGKIVKHRDSFDFYVWSKQALGLTGLFLGWSNFLKQKVQNTARHGLQRFMQKTASPSAFAKR